MNEPLLEITLRYPLDLSDFEGQDIYTKGNHWLMLEQSQDYVERSVKALADQFVEAFDTYHRPLEDIEHLHEVSSRRTVTEIWLRQCSKSRRSSKSHKTI